jgi:hypothetical protein
VALTNRYSGKIAVPPAPFAPTAFAPPLNESTALKPPFALKAVARPSPSPSAPISSSSACEVVVVAPELSVCGSAPLPVFVLDLSCGEGVASPSNEKTLAALYCGTVPEKVNVIVPPESALVTRAEKSDVLTPSEAELITSAFFV